MTKDSHNITISDVAKAANTSISTVSRVLSGSSYPVSADKRSRVLQAAAALGYEPNMLGRMLKTDVNPSIGIIIPSFQNPFYTQLIIGIEKEAHSKQLSAAGIQLPEKSRDREESDQQPDEKPGPGSYDLLHRRLPSGSGAVCSHRRKGLYF